MTRNLILLVAAALSIGTRTAVCVASETTPLVQDTFDDNKKGSMWTQYVDDPNCKVQEANKRLEFISKATTNAPIFAGYVANDSWRIDPGHNFTMRVTLTYDLVTMNGGWFSFGVTPTPTQPRKQYVSVGIGCTTIYPSYWREYKDGYEIRWDFESRRTATQTLYFSYDAETDTVYLSDTGYDPSQAWQTLTGVIRERWPDQPLYVFLGGSAETLQITSGHAYADNFALDSATFVKTSDTPTDTNDTTTDPNLVTTEVTGDAHFLPTVIKRQGAATAITALLTLPEGYLPADIDTTEPLTLLPGGAEATTWNSFVWLSGRTVVVGSFNRTKLLETVTTSGETTLQVKGVLKDGRHFGGTATVTLQ